MQGYVGGEFIGPFILISQMAPILGSVPPMYASAHSKSCSAARKKSRSEIADCPRFGRTPAGLSHAQLLVSITQAGFQSASCFDPGMVERN
jgi:hypothetical protein